jgi:hypothetical protein
MKNEIFIHEDFIKQIELIPRKNFFSESKQLSDLNNSEYSTFGFGSCQVREDRSFNLSDMNISLKSIKNILQPICIDFENHIYSGYGNTSYLLDNTIVWIFERYGVFIEHDKSQIISIWIYDSHEFPMINTPNSFSLALKLLGKEYNLLLTDWNQEIIVDINKSEKLEEYLAQVLLFQT